MSDSGAAARRAALAILRAVRADIPFDIALDEPLQGLSESDARLAHEIAAGVLRKRTALDTAIRPLVTAPWSRIEYGVRDLLRIGAYQLFHLERVPTYAAVQATVAAAKRGGHRGAAGLVNAVLRRLPDAPRPRPKGIAAQYSHPTWLVGRWRDRFGPERTEALLRRNNERPALTIRPLAWTGESLASALTSAGIEFEPDVDVGTLRLPTPGSVPDLPGYAEGAFLVQDTGQARLLAFADIDDGVRVWDACAAPGGKTAVLGNRGSVIASDLRVERIPRLKENLRRLNVEVPIFVGDAASPPLSAASVDVVLVDAPCSGTGTVQKHPDARWRLTAQRLGIMVRQQRAILEAVARIVRPGGLLVYLTCSIEAEENEDCINEFLQRHNDYHREGDDLFIFPPDADTDGGFGARMRRRR